jgi:hypothetical protein
MISRTDRSEAQKKLLETLGQLAEPFGFSAKPSGQSFYRRLPTGTWALHLSFIPHAADFDVTADVALRFNAVEDLVNQYDTKLSRAEGRRSMTMGAELGNLSEGRPIRWTVADIEEIPNVGRQVLNAFERIGLPFLQAHNDLVSLHRLLVGEMPITRLVAPISGPRYLRAIATACLLGAFDEVRARASQYEAALLNEQDLYLDEFRALCEYVKTQGIRLSTVVRSVH